MCLGMFRCEKFGKVPFFMSTMAKKSMLAWYRQ